MTRLSRNNLKQQVFRYFPFYRSGFTLIEILLYTAIVSLVISSFVLYGWNVVQGGAKSSHMEEVNSSARYISQRFKYEIRNASGINSISSSQISLSESIPAINPTIINFSTGQLTIQQGVASAVAINPSSTNISSLTFSNFSSGDNKTKNIQFLFTIESKYPSIGNIKDNVTIEGAAELRSN